MVTRSVKAGAEVTAWTDEADAVSLPRLDEVGGLVRPGNIGVSYAEREYAALAGEQEASWAAEGEQRARPWLIRAHGLAAAVAADQVVLAACAQELQQAKADYQHAVRVLLPYARREPGAKWRYALCWPVLVLGDMSGVWAAAVMHGEVPVIAFGQALASGVAAGCAGLVGSEFKALRMARARVREPDSLTEDERRYQRLFAGTDRGAGLVGLVGVVSLVVAALLAVGIALLRTSTEGIAAGAMFGLLAAATALASFLLGYWAADEVADLVATLGKRARRAERRYLQVAKSKAIMQRAETEEAARSVRMECALRGQAAARRVASLSWRIQRNNPQVFGHGFPAEDHVVGRRDRPSPDAWDGVAR
ncbi:hypothetical protein D0T12_18500 [Actinomadura spongiicola]|uniref:Uncharacterized protein n=1 Tax=Actinomadura spongiicola TaxID=2303421 RepID=A0A372GGD5_9ACTN|nr:hypothetical protein [Actinomadura spongiicola]RFS84149.1 hypothetical protein D0T12_18500 [Actinomadura spongiicola]